MALAVELLGLSKSYGNALAVDQLSLQIPTGCFYALLGSNGVGKTTTLRMITGLLKPDQGDAVIMGNSINRRPQAAKQVMAYVPDELALYNKLKPLEYLEFIAGLWKMEPEKSMPLAEKLLKELGLWERREEFTEAFSQGMKQRLALAGAFVHEPQVMLLDEPLTGIDAPAARVIKDKLRDYVAQGNTVIMTTHIMSLAEELADRIGVIDGGHLLAEGTLADLRSQVHQPAHTLEDVFIQLVPHPVAGGA